MSFLEKYLKYKSKYLKLKQIGGTYTTTINLVVPNLKLFPSNKQNVLVQDPYLYKDNIEKINIFKNNFLQRIEDDNIKNMNDEAEALYSSAKKGNFSSDIFSELYDTIGAIYYCSKPIQDLWNQLAAELKLNIAIFYGESDMFTNIKEKDYIFGINILAGCSTEKIAVPLNTDENNKIGKYFIGFKNYIHSYGSSFYICKNSLEMTSEEFVTAYEGYSSELPIIKIIKIFYDKFKSCSDPNCRSCRVITIQKIKEKLQSLKFKIENKEKFNKRDKYFDSNYQIECNSGNCDIDPIFEDYIRNILNDIKQKEADKIQKEADKIQRWKDWKFIRNKLVLETSNDTDITKYYDKFFVDYDFYSDKLNDVCSQFSYDRCSDTIICSNKDSYKIYLKKSNKNNEYYKFVRTDKDKNIVEFYFDNSLEPINPNGSKIDYNDEDWGPADPDDTNWD
jgi:hypothetical protein